MLTTLPVQLIECRRLEVAIIGSNPIESIPEPLLAYIKANIKNVIIKKDDTPEAAAEIQQTLKDRGYI
jgi:hypothetical protein